MMRRRIALLAVLVAALATAVTGGVWAATRTAGRPVNGMMTSGYGAHMMGGAGMMRGSYDSYRTYGNGRPVESLDAARQQAQVLADQLGLRAGEVMSFSNGFSVELVTADRQGATEVLVDPADGSVRVEYGPAMLWNTTYGMHPGIVAGTPLVSAAEATTAAQRWLDGQRPGVTTADPQRFPGYYTLHTMRGGKIVGMMSINTITGAVWYHTWHGQFIAMSEG